MRKVVMHAFRLVPVRLKTALVSLVAPALFSLVPDRASLACRLKVCLLHTQES